MAQAGRPKPPLDVLQSMINAILIETGKALRPSNKDGGRTLATVSSRLRTIIPSALENFHMALDELECDIVRAKSVLLRDLEELRSKRIALENPVPILEEVKAEAETIIETNRVNDVNMVSNENGSSPKVRIKEEARAKSPEEQIPNEPERAVADSSAEAISQDSADVKVPQGSTPPASSNETTTDSKPVGLGINTEDLTSGSAPGTAELQNSSIDSLFDIPDDDNAGDSGLNFDTMDFSIHDSTQDQDTSQTQNNDFDLSNFENPSQDFSMADLNTSTNSNQANPNTSNQNKPEDDLFGMVETSGGDDNMDLDLGMGMAGAEDSVFDDMFFGEADDTVMSGGGEMQHGDFDNAFFGLE